MNIKTIEIVHKIEVMDKEMKRHEKLLGSLIEIQRLARKLGLSITSLEVQAKQFYGYDSNNPPPEKYLGIKIV